MGYGEINQSCVDCWTSKSRSIPVSTDVIEMAIIVIISLDYCTNVIHKVQVIRIRLLQ